MNKNYIAFFDLDHTILNESSGELFMKEAIEKKIYSSFDLLLIGLDSLGYLVGFNKPQDMIHRWASFHKNWPVQKMQDLCKDWLIEKVIPEIRDLALKEIELHRSQGGKVVLLSASTNYICEPLSKHLGLDDFLCTYLEEKNAILTGKIDGAYVYGPVKKVYAQKYCEERNINPQDCYYYGDSYADRFVQSYVAHAVAVNPGKKLRQFSERNNWRIVKW